MALRSSDFAEVGRHSHLNFNDPTNRSHYVVQLNRENTRTIDRRGGTMLHTG
jgi:hypothetical protein